MNSIRAIRQRLSVTQGELAAGLGCSQSNVSFYEQGQTVPPSTAKKLIEFAANKGHVVTYDEIYAEPAIEPQKPSDTPPPEPGMAERTTEPRRKAQRRAVTDRRGGNDRRTEPGTPA